MSSYTKCTPCWKIQLGTNVKVDVVSVPFEFYVSLRTFYSVTPHDADAFERLLHKFDLTSHYPNLPYNIRHGFPIGNMHI